MKITDEDLEEFQAIYKEEFGKEISKELALDAANKLIRITQIIMDLD
jgi:hypothetical protein